MAILTSIMVIPLGVITFSLRALREQQSAGRSDLTRRIESNEGELQRLNERLASFDRDYATKEDWLRECMLARHDIARMSRTLARLDSDWPRRLRPTSAAGCVTVSGLDEMIPYEGTD